MKRKTLLFVLLITASTLLAGCESNEKKEQETPEIIDTITSESESGREKYDTYVTLGDYNGITTGLSVKEVTEKDIDTVVSETVEAAGGYFEIEDGAEIKEGCQAQVSMQPISDTESSPSDMTITIGDESYPKEFSDALIGLKAGESTTVNLSEEDGGMGYVLTVIDVLVPAEITDEFVKGLQIENVNNIEELREDIRKYLEDQNADSYNEELKEAVAKYIYDKSEVHEVPEALLESCREVIEKKIDILVENKKESEGEDTEVTRADVLEGQMKEDEYVGTVEDYITWYAGKNAKEYMIYSVIAEKEDIIPSEDEIYSAIAADWSNDISKYPTLIEFIEENGKEQYERSVLSKAVIEYMAEHSKEGLIKKDPDLDTKED